MVFFLTACAGMLLCVEYYFFVRAYLDMSEYRKKYQHLVEVYKTALKNNQQRQSEDTFKLGQTIDSIDEHSISSNQEQAQKRRPKSQKDLALLQLPIERSQFWLSSRFGPRKKRDGSWGYHYGIDMASAKGTPVGAAASGVVIEASYSKKGYGKTIVIRHKDGIHQARYAHLDEIFVRVGQEVKVRQRIGLVGATGFVRGENGNKNASHLHFEVKKQGKHIDPFSILA